MFNFNLDAIQNRVEIELNKLHDKLSTLNSNLLMINDKLNSLYSNLQTVNEKIDPLIAEHNTQEIRTKLDSLHSNLKIISEKIKPNVLEFRNMLRPAASAPEDLTQTFFAEKPPVDTISDLAAQETVKTHSDPTEFKTHG